MAVYLAALNVSDSPVVVDDEGRMLGGGDWGPVRRNEQVRVAADAGDLHLFPGGVADEPGQNPEAVRAAKRAAELTERSAAFANLDREQLGGMAGDAGVLPEGVEDLPDKDHLVERLALSSAEVPTAEVAANDDEAEASPPAASASSSPNRRRRSGQE